MKVAVCISGQLRTWRRCAPTHRAFLDGTAADVFLHAWQDETGPVAEAAAYYSAKLVVRTRQRAWNEIASTIWKRGRADKPGKSLPMFQAIHDLEGAVSDYESQHGKYEVIVRLRPDLFLDIKLSAHLSEIEPLVAIIPYHGTQGINDQLAIGGREYFKSYARIAGNLEPHANKVRFSPHVVLRHQFALDGIRIRVAKLRYAILRAHHPFSSMGEVEQAILREAPRSPHARIIQFNLR
jgi:hypothetical protein